MNEARALQHAPDYFNLIHKLKCIHFQADEWNHFKNQLKAILFCCLNLFCLLETEFMFITYDTYLDSLRQLTTNGTVLNTLVS